MYYVGLDVHHKTSTCHILNANGQSVKRWSKTIAGHWGKMIDYLQKLAIPMSICYEASLGYGTLYDRIKGITAKITVAHPGKLRLIYSSHRKNDRLDAQRLAKLLYLDEVPEIHVPSLTVRNWRELIEFRRREVDKRTQIKNAIRALLRQYGIVKPQAVGGLWAKKGQKWLKSVDWPTADTLLRCDILLTQLDSAYAIVDRLTQRLDDLGQEDAAVQLLKSIPGVGPRTAEALVAYIDKPHRFKRTNQVGSYFGLVPTQDASAAVNRMGHISKRGPGTVRKLLIEASWQLIRKSDVMRTFFDRISQGKKDQRKVALVAVAHKVVRVVLAMLKSGEVYREASLV